MPALGRLLVVVGLLVAVLGLILTVVPKLPGTSWMGRLPGDIHVVRPNVRIYVPLTTSLLVSVILTVLLYFLRR